MNQADKEHKLVKLIVSCYAKNILGNENAPVKIGNKIDLNILLSFIKKMDDFNEKQSDILKNKNPYQQITDFLATAPDELYKRIKSRQTEKHEQEWNYPEILLVYALTKNHSMNFYGDNSPYPDRLLIYVATDLGIKFQGL